MRLVGSTSYPIYEKLTADPMRGGHHEGGNIAREATILRRQQHRCGTAPDRLEIDPSVSPRSGRMPCVVPCLRAPKPPHGQPCAIVDARQDAFSNAFYAIVAVRGAGTSRAPLPSHRKLAVAEPRRKSWPRRLVRWALYAGLAWFVFGIAAVVLLRFVPPPVSAVMAEDWIGAKLRGDSAYALHYRWVAWDRVAPALPLSLVAAEDQRFPQHHGFDFVAIQKALDEADDGERLRGASTISQQVAKNLFLWNGRSFVRKGLEAYFTVLIETLWPKRRILEMYLNIAQFGDGIYGAGAASQVFFRTTPDRLDAQQAALLAAVLPNPLRFKVDKPSAYVMRRVAWIRHQTESLGGVAYLPR